MTQIALNTEIENLLKNIGCPVAYMFYEGNADTYITYQQTFIEDTLAGDDALIYGVYCYDFDIYSKTNFINLAVSLINTMTAAGWTYQPSRNSPDLYERDTKFYHKTICLARESEV